MKNGCFLAACFALMTLSTACHQSLPAKVAPQLAQLRPQISYTAVVKDAQDLPRCDNGTEGMKAYIKNQDDFLKCQAFAWRGSRPGATEGRYEDRAPVRYNEWTDAKANRRWSARLREEISEDGLKESVCQKGFALPTTEELRVASANGLFDGLKAHGGVAFDRAWTNEKAAVAGLSRGSFENVTVETAKTKEMKAGVYCVNPA